MGQHEQQQRLAYLIERLIAEEPRWARACAAGDLALPDDPGERFRLYRSLVNMREPRAVDAEYVRAEDAYLQEELQARGVVTLDEVRQAAGATVAAGVTGAAPHPELLLWQGDITRLAVDGIVNAANSALLGCRVPCHNCIDNAIHTAAGARLRLACDEQMRAQGAPEPTGRAKITPGFNLPAAHVLHTVGPIVRGAAPAARDCADLASCYRSCLDLAAEHGLGSIAFCCISTGEFCFPKREAARIAVREVRAWLARAASANADGAGPNAGCGSGAGAGRAPALGTATATTMPTAGTPSVATVIFDVFGDEDFAIYRELLRDPAT